MARTLSVLALGSFVLLGASIALVVEGLDSMDLKLPAVIPLMTAFAIAIHFWAWVRLGQDLLPYLGASNPGASTKGAMAWAYLASIIGAALGLATLGFAWPVQGGFVPPTFRLLISGLFAHIPSVFAPVLVGHFVMFQAGSRAFRIRAARRLAIMGGIVLAAIATISLASQLFFFQVVGHWIWIFGGLTTVPYAILATGWSQEYKALVASSVS